MSISVRNPRLLNLQFSSWPHYMRVLSYKATVSVSDALQQSKSPTDWCTTSLSDNCLSCLGCFLLQNILDTLINMSVCQLYKVQSQTNLMRVSGCWRAGLRWITELFPHLHTFQGDLSGEQRAGLNIWSLVPLQWLPSHPHLCWLQLPQKLFS